MLDPDYGDITDVHEGHDVKVTCTKQPGKMYAMTDVMPRPKATALGNKKQIDEWTSNIPELDDLYSLKSYEQLETIINNWLNGEDETSEPEEKVQAEKVRPSRKAARGNTGKNYGDDLDDAFADLEEDLGF